MGAVTPFGWGLEPFARGLEAARVAIGPLKLFSTEGHRTRIAGEVPPGIEAALADLPPKRRARLTRSDGFALAAAREALATGRLDVALEDAGLFLGTSTGGMLEGESFFWELRPGAERRPAMSRIASQQHNGPSGAVARELGIGGPVVTLSSACSAAGMAIEAALRSLRAGEVAAALAGGADSLCQLTYAGFNALRAVDEAPCRPFRAGRAGLSLGEGAGVLLLETEARARARGARVLAELSGAGSSCDAHHMTAPDPEGEGLALAIEKALADAELDPREVHVINAHGTATPLNDAAEWKALERVFGARLERIPILATKAAVGHLLGACGGVEAVATLLALARATLHPTRGDGEIDPACPARLVTGEPRPLDYPANALSVNLAFGGADVALVFRAERALASSIP
jgi:3-oxoacyl-[acyl-carrier-protein] synthase II